MRKIDFKPLLLGLMACLSWACANRGVGPQGGPKDETPPLVLKETPLNGTLNYQGKTIEVVFDEYIQLDNVSENVLVSPPQQRPPEITAVGKKLRVVFAQDLQDSTTYALDFGSAICDNNEKNPLPGYIFAFSTGPVIDSLEVAGLLLNAENLNPVSGVFMGLHDDLADSAFTTKPFVRIGKTDAYGEFYISNLKAGTYRLYGLKDMSRDYMWQPGEGVALYDSLLVPSVTTTFGADTIWTDSLTVDSIIPFMESVYEPSSLVAFYFEEDKPRHYFMRCLRDKQHYFTLYFGAPQDSLPRLQALGEDWLQYALCQPNNTKDTITYWLTDSVAIAKDTLAFTMQYYKSDSLFQLQPQTDTLRAVYRAPRLSDKAKAQMEKNKAKTQFLNLKTNAQTPFEIYEPLRLTSPTPLSHFVPDSMHLYQIIDSVPHALPFEWEVADSAHMSYLIHYPWQAEKQYEFCIDSAAVKDIYGTPVKALKAPFKIRTLDEYSTLLIRIEPFDSCAVIQILNEKDEPVRTLSAQPDGAKALYLKPQSYYLRLFLDLNHDGKWTTGDVQAHRQPEPVYYFSSKLTLRANWDFEETFPYLDKPIEQQKPAALLPKVKTSKTQNASPTNRTL